MIRDSVIFDGDDTLWILEPLYDRARRAVGDLVEARGLDRHGWESRQRELDLSRVKHLGLASSRFPESCALAFAAMMENGDQPSGGILDEIRVMASQVFEWQAPLTEGVHGVLEKLGERSTLGLLTQGEEWVQRKRISDSGLETFFAQIWVVNRKTKEDFQRMVTSLGSLPHLAWSVGNSLPSDINPALSIGMGAVWIEADVWEHEHRERTVLNGMVLRAKRLTDVPHLIHRERFTEGE